MNFNARNLLNCIKNQKAEIALDFESSRLPVQSNAITQAVMIYHDSDREKPIRFKEFKVRPNEFYVYSPGAALATGVAPAKMYFEEDRLSTDEAALQMYDIGGRTKNTTLYGFNNQYFDHRLANQCAYEHGLPGYFEKQNGNTTACTRNLSIFTHAVSNPLRGKVLPLRSTGYYGSTLSEIATNLGITADGQYHDARTDTVVTADLRRTLTRGDPEVEEFFIDNQHHNFIRRALANSPACLKFNFSKKNAVNMKLVTHIESSSFGEHWLACLELDPEENPENVGENLIKSLKSKSCRISYTKTKETPLHLPVSHPMSRRLLSSEVIQKFTNYGRKIQNDPAIKEAVAEFEKSRKANFKQSDYYETQMHEGFYTRTDIEKRRRWHVAPPEQKAAIIESIQDDRMRHFLNRIMYRRFPGFMPVKKLKKMQEFLDFRLTTGDVNVPWQTVPDALEKIELLLETTVMQQHQNLLDYRKFLLELQSNPTLLRRAA
jgi:exonuclease I